MTFSTRSKRIDSSDGRQFGIGSSTGESFLVAISASRFYWARGSLDAISILDTLLHMFGHQIECRLGTDHEPEGAPRLGFGAALDAEADLDRPGLVLRLLRPLRPTFEFDHDEIESACLDEPDRHRCWYHWKLHGRHEGCLEFIVSFLAPRALIPR